MTSNGKLTKHIIKRYRNWSHTLEDHINDQILKNPIPNKIISKGKYIIIILLMGRENHPRHFLYSFTKKRMNQLNHFLFMNKTQYEFYSVIECENQEVQETAFMILTNMYTEKINTDAPPLSTANNKYWKQTPATRRQFDMTLKTLDLICTKKTFQVCRGQNIWHIPTIEKELQELNK